MDTTITLMSFFGPKRSSVAGSSTAASTGEGSADAGGATKEDSDEGGDGDPPSMLHLLLKLPQALTTTILKRLDVSSAGKLACTSRAFCEATADPEVRAAPPPLKKFFHGTIG